MLLIDKLIENIFDPCNSKEHDQLFIRKKNTKSVKKSKTITYQPKTFENTIIFYIKSVITEHPKASRKLSKNEKVGSNSTLYSDTKKVKIINEKNVKITKRKHAFKGFASPYNFELLNPFNLELHSEDTEYAIKSKLIDILPELRGIQFVTASVLVFKKIEREDKTKYELFYSNSKAEIIINKNVIDDLFQSIYTTIISIMQKCLGKGSGWISDSVIDHTASISKYNPLPGSSYIKLSKQLYHSRKGFINIQNIDDNECFKWSIVRFLNPANHHPARIAKADKDFANKN